jgi:hypothetical protein
MPGKIHDILISRKNKNLSKYPSISYSPKNFEKILNGVLLRLKALIILILSGKLDFKIFFLVLFPPDFVVRIITFHLNLCRYFAKLSILLPPVAGNLCTIIRMFFMA